MGKVASLICGICGNKKAPIYENSQTSSPKFIAVGSALTRPALIILVPAGRDLPLPERFFRRLVCGTERQKGKVEECENLISILGKEFAE